MGETGSNQPCTYLLAQEGGCGLPVLIDLSLRHCSVEPALAEDAHWVREAQARQPTLASAFASLSYTLITEGGSCFIAWLESIAVFPFLKSNVAWAKPPSLWGTIRMKPSGQPRAGTAGRELTLPWPLPRCHYVPDAMCILKQLPQEMKGVILGLCSCLQTLKSAKAKPAHFNKVALI